ncbi:hypothetical protein ThidrDRAFT_2914 [Thiorhodococcus drewsii AZ1]|uniref:Right handed beta helix domain-containing protein n=1 Tax=Thiorhodococcus drewsii AZ1 TaxID=765913 RepID=G2E3Q1_9GAMM|nr:right-handed parallel beta-helix repeat-containing protein [Thiorhodococcus drewsii]EGV30164.1 hypothetical protein ThidrDRAFT_2914 [Thiorhodococcus drewsii AZ1]
MHSERSRNAVVVCTPDTGWDGLAEALAAAGPGDRIRCAAGDYHGAVTLRVPTGVTLEADPGASLLWTGTGSALQVEGEAVAIKGIAIRASRPPSGDQDDSSDRIYEALLLILDSHGVQVTDCSFRKGGEDFYGISIRRSKAVVIETCVAEGCRNGIAAWSSEWCGTANRCFGNVGNGIALGRDPETLDVPSSAPLLANRCHDNQGPGVLFSSSHGRAEGNDCWGNGAGIVAQRDENSPDAPSDVALLGNRCHDNQEAGVVFLSSQGCAEGNDCWGNGTSGITAQRGSNSPDAPSDVALLANRCHDNQEAGVGFASSQGRAEGNDWLGEWRTGNRRAARPEVP